MADLEKVHVKLGISGTYWDRKPLYSVLFNDQEIQTAAVSGASGEIEYVEFDAEYDTELAVLKIRLFNKVPTDTVLTRDRTGIEKDMLLNIVSIEIDKIDLGPTLPWKLSEYHTDQSVQFHGENTHLVKNCVNLGWNGTWSLTWSNPFYIWLLENI